MSNTIKQADIIYEENYYTEEWMSSPFESRYADVDLSIENWMTSPFESTYAEAELILEDWMSSPFESTYAEAELFVEDWMSSPFDAADHIEIESWMTAAF
jgi:hypothetical protein